MLTVSEGNKFDWTKIPLEDCLKGNALDAHYTIKIYQHLLEELQAKNLEVLYEKLISPVTPILMEMEYNGMHIDQEELANLKAAILKKLEDLTERLNKSEGLPPGANFSSSHDLIKILFSLERNKEKEWIVDQNYGFGLYPFATTDKGQPQTTDEVITSLQEMVEQEYSRRGLNAKK